MSLLKSIVSIEVVIYLCNVTDSKPSSAGIPPQGVNYQELSVFGMGKRLWMVAYFLK